MSTGEGAIDELLSSSAFFSMSIFPARDIAVECKLGENARGKCSTERSFQRAFLKPCPPDHSRMRTVCSMTHLLDFKLAARSNVNHLNLVVNANGVEYLDSGGL